MWGERIYRGVARVTRQDSGGSRAWRKIRLWGLVSFFFFGMVFSASVCLAESRGQGIEQILRNQGVLDPYMVDLVEETANTLVRLSGEWPSAVVNGGYRQGAVNIYLIDGERLPNRNVLASYGLDLSGRRFGKALVDERSGIIFLDTRFLKSFVAYRMFLEDDEIEPIQAAAYVRMRGVEPLRGVWSPAANAQLRSRRFRDRWLLAYRGMLAFILGHEMGHILLGPRSYDFDAPIEYETKEDRDLQWACRSFLDSSYQQKQQLERQADEYSVSLLGQVLIPDDLSPRRLLYELGAHMYLSYELKNEILNAALVTERPVIHLLLRAQLGDELYAEVMKKGARGKRGAIHVFYPRSHPATLQRVLGSLATLARSRYSAFHNEGVGIEPEYHLLTQLVGEECQRLRRRGP